MIPKIGKVTTESVHKATGKHWHEWIPILEKAGARTLTHREIAQYLKKKHKLGPWWQQWVTVGYEIHVGRRIEGQNAKGEYMSTTTKSIARDVSAIWKFLVSEAGVAIWLRPLYPVKIREGAQFETEDGYFGEVRTLKKERRIRVAWQSPDWPRKTTLELQLGARPGKKSMIVLNHTQIVDLKVLARMRARWKTAAEEIARKLSVIRL